MSRAVNTASLTRDEPRAALLAAVTTMLLWSSGNVLAKYIGLPGIQLAFYRIVVGAALYAGVLAVTGRRLTWRTVRLALPGAVAFSLDVCIFFTAIKWTTVANATVIAALQPIMLLFVADRLFGEKLNPRAVALIAVTLGGVTLVVFGSAESPVWSPSGDALAFLATVVWAWYFVASKKARKHLGAIEYQTAVLIIGPFIVLPLALLSEGGLARPSASELALVFVMALVPGTGHLLMNWAHAYLPITLTSTLTLSLPVLSTIGAALVLGEAIVAWQIVGMAVVIAGLALLIRVDAPTIEPP